MEELLLPVAVFQSLKDAANQFSPDNAVFVSIQEIFLSPANIRCVSDAMYKTLRSMDIKSAPAELEKVLKTHALEWSAKKHVDSAQSAVTWDWIETLSFVNKRFVKEHVCLFRLSQMGESNVFKATTEFVTPDGVEEKLGREMTADEYKNMNVWGLWQVHASSDKFRYRNIIPVWQTAGAKRLVQMDRENEGLHDRNWRTASRPVPIRGYDMSEIVRRSTDKYKDLAYTYLEYGVD